MTLGTSFNSEPIGTGEGLGEGVAGTFIRLFVGVTSSGVGEAGVSVVSLLKSPDKIPPDDPSPLPLTKRFHAR